MATCFRGAVPFARSSFFLLPRLPCRAAQPSPFAALRFFTSSTPRAEAKPDAVRVRPNARQRPPFEGYKPNGWLPAAAVEKQLASKGAETILYSAPKQTSFRIVCYVGAFACFGAAASSYQFFFNDLKDKKDRNGLASWVPLAFGVIAVFWACIGTWLAAAPVGIVRSIIAVPKLGPQNSVALRVEIMRLPGMKDKIVYAPPSDVTCDGSIAATTAEYAVARKAVLDARRPQPGDPVILKPFLALGRWVSRSFYSIMIYTKMSMMREGFVKISVRNEAVAKIDCAGELAMGGQVLDQLIRRM